MSRRCATRSAAALGALAVFVALALPARADTVRILYTNDLHLRLGRLASIEREIAAARESGDSVLLLDAGDTWQDFRVPLYATWGAETMVQWMNRVGYDAMALGNHDFYWSWPKVGDLVTSAAFPVLCANLAAVDSEASPFPASRRISVGGCDVLIVGITALELLPALDFPWLRPVDPASALRREVESALGDVDLVVCLAHVPVRVAEQLARAVPQVDVFVTGHSHETTEAPRVVGDSLIVQSGAFGRWVGELVLEIDDGSVRCIDHSLLPTQEEAAADTGRGFMHLLAIAVAILAFSIALLL